jgi:hypothetical protein
MATSLYKTDLIWRLIQKSIVHTKLDIYFFITMTEWIPLLLDY